MEHLTQEEAILVQLGIWASALHILRNKRLDYSGEVDPFGNFRRSELRGVPAWLGCMIRNDDKFARREVIMKRGGEAHVKNETLIDTWADSTNYVSIEAGLEIEILPNRTELLRNLTDIAHDLPDLVQFYLDKALLEKEDNGTT